MDFDWGTSIPAGTALTSGDNFSVRWTGQMEPQFPETCTFRVAADNGSRLWSDDKLIAVDRSFGTLRAGLHKLAK